jgi:hypothetical protein
MRDNRIATAALKVAQTPSHPESVRIAALALLLMYADPYSSPSFPELVPPAGWTPGQRARVPPIGRRLHAVPQQNGEIPLSSGYVSDLLTVLRSLGASDFNPRIQYVAIEFARSLERRGTGHMDP